MASLNQFCDHMLSKGKAFFTREEILEKLDMSSQAFIASANRLKRKKQLACPYRGFYLILRPEDRFSGSPDPEYWIDPLMRYLGIEYRISLLQAAALHGATHQAAMVFQVIAPRQLREIEIGRYRIQFVYQTASIFANTNNPNWLVLKKSQSGFANVAGVELTLLDCTRYFHKAGGINGVAQIVKDVGEKASITRLANAAKAYENSAVRRLGYLLEQVGHKRQSEALVKLAKRAKSIKQLDPSARKLSDALTESHVRNFKWMLEINEIVEVDY